MRFLSAIVRTNIAPIVANSSLNYFDLARAHGAGAPAGRTQKNSHIHYGMPKKEFTQQTPISTFRKRPLHNDRKRGPF